MPLVSRAESVHCAKGLTTVGTADITVTDRGHDYSFNPISLSLSGPLVLDTLPRLVIDLWRIFLEPRLLLFRFLQMLSVFGWCIRGLSQKNFYSSFILTHYSSPNNGYGGIS